MAIIISALMFLFIVLLLTPKQWVEASSIKKRLAVEEEVLIEEERRFTIRKATPAVMRMLSLVNFRLSIERREQLETKIQMAGKAEKYRVEDILTMKMITAVGLMSYFLFLGVVGSSPMLFLVAMVTALMGYILPEHWLKILGSKRKDQIKKELPYVINAIAIMSEAGLNLVPAIKEVADKKKGVLADELQMVIRDVSVGVSQVTALERLAERCQVDEVNRFVSAVTQNLERGASGVTRVLRNQASEVWQQRKKKAQELGEKASMKLFLPLLLLAFPATAIFLLGPAILGVMDFILSMN
ncbi:type II secretion system F family protein [Geomicrobium sp. JCM 19055]|uniref:type II secretion system F family protein n=1 Tax=Geomicrobium sp. JCM 19055 TaxID=1460649 RepID=UPI0005AA9616|nr:type II secretion system F family protein [Geomicrobium sp. JCM 19055]